MFKSLDNDAHYFREAASSFLAASKRCEIDSLENLLVMGHLVFAVTHSIHSIQKERGASTLYLCREKTPFRDQLDQFRRETDESLVQLTVAWQVNTAQGSKGVDHTRLFSRLAHASMSLVSLSELRGNIVKRELDAGNTFEAYSDLVRNLLAIVFEAADCAEEPRISRLLVALFHFMEGKEFAGQERALGSGALAFADEEKDILSQIQRLIAEQNRCFEIFEKFADEISIKQWQENRSCKNWLQFENLRERISLLKKPLVFDEEFCAEWFICATKKIDDMKQIEMILVSSFQMECGRKLEWVSGQKDETMSRSSQFSSGFIVYSRDAYFEEFGMIHNGPEGKFLGKSLIHLLQIQGQRLENLNEELAATKEVLKERKLVDKAKFLLMERRGLTEQEAYKMMRDISMKQNSRMATVAKRLIEMKEIL